MLYLDTSALVKRYVQESQSDAVRALIAREPLLATSTLSRVEAAAAFSNRLRGYDAVHLASALEWQDRLGEAVTLATFDQELWRAASDAGLERFPVSL